MVANDWQKWGTGLWRTRWKSLFPEQPESWWEREKEEKYTPICLFNNDMVFLDGRFLTKGDSWVPIRRKTEFSIKKAPFRTGPFANPKPDQSNQFSLNWPTRALTVDLASP